MKKLNNKGFTIVELVIVVAVIAILAAVLIPTVSGLIKTAQTSADVTLVKNVNLFLATERATEGKNTTMQEALDDALNGGYDVTKLTPTNSDNYILWDQESDNFVLFANGKYNNAGAEVKVTDEYKLWNIADKTEGSKYSVYYTGDATEVAVNGVGFDVGKSSVAVVNYTSSVANDVIINTNGGTLNVGTEGEVAKGTIYHNGTLVAANVYTESNSFHTNGKIASLNLQAGKAVVENGAYVGLTAAAAGTTVEEKGGLFYVADENNINAEVLAILNNGTDRSYKIGSKAELIEFRKAWNSGALATGTFTLTADIDISGENWAPIGNWEFPFNGTFNGNNHTISGLTAVGTCEDGIYSVGDNIGYGETFGFFGIVGNGDVAINDLTLSNVNIDLINGKNVGALIGYAPKTENFTEDGKGKTFAGDKWVGNKTVGTHSITLNGVTVSGNVTATAHVGGLVGKDYSSGALTLTNCTSEAVVSASAAGGLSAFVAYISGPSSATFDSCSTGENSKLIATGTGVNSIGDLYGYCNIAASITSFTSQTKLELPANFGSGITRIRMHSNCVIEGATLNLTAKLMNQGNLTLKNCTINGTNVLENDSNLTIEGSTLNVVLNNFGEVLIKSGTFSKETVNGSKDNATATMTIQDGSFTKSDKSGNVISNYGSLTITGYTTITNTKDDYYNDTITCTGTASTIIIGNDAAQSGTEKGTLIIVSSVKK